METSAQQRRRGGNRQGNDSAHRKPRSGGVSKRDSGGAGCRPISPFPGEAAVDTESRWEAEAIRHTDGSGPGGADGGEDSDRTDLRGGLSAVQLRLPTEEERDTGTGSASALTRSDPPLLG